MSIRSLIADPAFQALDPEVQSAALKRAGAPDAFINDYIDSGITRTHPAPTQPVSPHSPVALTHNDKPEGSALSRFAEPFVEAGRAALALGKRALTPPPTTLEGIKADPAALLNVVPGGAATADMARGIVT